MLSNKEMYKYVHNEVERRELRYKSVVDIVVCQTAGHISVTY